MTKQILSIENIESNILIDRVVDKVENIFLKHSDSLHTNETLLTREETAEMLSISLVTLWKYTKDNIIPAYRIGTKVRYKKSEVLLALKKMNQF
ncbi:helix-turn-helix domain-containing protein [Maribacter confluentis]|uniref:Helix-turn-helix domain-containing protein n=1 Tax=Maribacter confluentis TaxID=1656093 RepID=A0ABT8RRG5_9FLAO|nr:helix-turn-helix domain-containing protein [Maribacter confluentis]MDO1513280.1 helix-turn-helix domain-containing protein [Maribacter confluentis]